MLRKEKNMFSAKCGNAKNMFSAKSAFVAENINLRFFPHNPIFDFIATVLLYPVS